MTTLIVHDFTMHGSSGHNVLRSKWLDWVAEHQGMEGCSRENGFGFGQTTHYSWYVDGRKILVRAESGKYWCQLPDSSGFIIFDDKRDKDNCVLLDVYGKERMRLIVPWELVGREIPETAEMWFRNIDGPYVNPVTGKQGNFGVSAWIEYAGDYYFELDYHTGKFLWGKAIRY